MFTTPDEAQNSGVRSAQQGFLHRVRHAVVRRIHDMGLLPRLLIAETLVLVALFAGGVLLIGYMTQSLRDNIMRDRLLLGQVIAEDLDASLEHGITELQQLSIGYAQTAQPNSQTDIQGAVDLLLGETTIFTRGIMVVGEDGKVLETDGQYPQLADLNLRTYWPELWTDPNIQSDVMANTFMIDGQSSPSVAIAVPTNRGQIGEFVVGLIDAQNSYPAEILSRTVRFGESGHADIVNRQGVAIFSTEEDHLLSSSDHLDSYRSAFLTHAPVIAEFPNGESSRSNHLMAYVPLKALPWAISSGTTASEAFAPVRHLWYGGLGFLTVLIGVAFIATFIVARKLVRPVKLLNQAAKSVAGGDREATIEIPWGGEIGELARSLETMRSHLEGWASELQFRVRERTTELEERHEELTTLYESIRQTEDQLRTILGKVLSAQEDERKRVSRELHDGIGQALSVLSMGLEQLEQTEPAMGSDHQMQVESLKEIAAVSLTDLRRMIVALRPAALDDLGLVPAIRRYADLYLGGADVEYHILEEGLNTRLDSALEAIIYRVAQEAINNVARHSDATQATIQFSFTEDSAALSVEDNGRGFDVVEAKLKDGVGLQGMEERATISGGKLTISSQPDQGTIVRLEVPCIARKVVSPVV